VGFTAGRDGVVVYERGGNAFAPVLSAAQPMSGWTHLAVVYRAGTPSLFVNGRLVKSGQRSGRTVHPGLGSPDANVRFVHFEGDNSEPVLIRGAVADDRIRELAATVPDPDLPPAALVATGSAPGLWLWENGEYVLQSAGGRRATVRVTDLPAPAR
jgi:hypothetical protein